MRESDTDFDMELENAENARTALATDRPELMTVKVFRRLYSISNTQVYREVAAGRLQIRKLGAATRIARADAEAWASALPIARRAGGISGLSLGEKSVPVQREGNAK